MSFVIKPEELIELIDKIQTALILTTDLSNFSSNVIKCQKLKVLSGQQMIG